MKQRINPLRILRFKKICRNPVKVTALLYLRDALLQERYEDCAEFVRTAREFGAKPFEIQNLLEDPRRMLGP